jgi:hypothetical protein
MPADRRFGHIRKLPSGRLQASYLGPDGKRHNAPTTFTTKGDAEMFLAMTRGKIVERRWRPAAQGASRNAQANPTVADYAEPWLADRDLKPRTRDHYQRVLDRLILPVLGDLPLTSITPMIVRSWHAGLV